MPEIVTMGELLVEIMRTSEDVDLFKVGDFRGPYPSGAPGIFIDTVARLGHSACIIGGVGDDDFGKVIIDRLKADGVDLSHLIVSSKGPTATAHVTYFSNGDRKFIFHVDKTPAVEAMMPASLEYFKDTKYFHIMGCSLTASIDFGREILKTMHAFKDMGATISFDPNVRLEMLKYTNAFDLVQEVYRNCQIFMPGVSELLMITGENETEAAIKKAFEENGRLKLIVLKNGSKGSSIYTRNGLEVVQQIFRVEQVDATGAGDCFDAAFICGLAEGKSLKEAAQMGAAAGALNVMAFGPMEGRITRETIQEMIIKNR